MAQDRNNNERNEQGKDQSSGGELSGGIGRDQVSDDRDSGTGLDEKSSTMGRRDKSSGLATKDGLTGSDFDGQVTQ